MKEEYSLLFVDDDPTAGDLLQRFCEGTAYNSQIYHDPIAALSYFKEHGADVVITDLQMQCADAGSPFGIHCIILE